MWIPSHIGLKGNELVDERTRHAALNGVGFDRPLSLVDFQGLARCVLVREWQRSETLQILIDSLTLYSRRFFLDLWPQREDRKFISTVSRIMSGLCAARSHLSRFRIVEEAMCVCLKDYETVDHLIWHCHRFKTERRHLNDALTAALKNCRSMRCCLDFVGSLGIRIGWLGCNFSRIAGQMVPQTLNG
jgi:hypothetical protein